MRIYDDRYSRDQRRLDIALRFIRHEARTRTIRTWTGLSDDRIRKLYRSYAAPLRGAPLARHRGKSPQQAAHFTRTARTRQEAALLASLYRLAGALPGPPELPRAEQPRVELPRAPLIPGLQRGELLCQSYDAFRALLPEAALSFEHAVYLLTALARGDELKLVGCRDCGAVLVSDRWALHAPRCAVCSSA
jgi:hypothetical protein